MNKNKSLFTLIKSMNGNEKRFFKIHANRHVIGEQNNYVRLFDLFDNYTEFDNDTIEKQASKASFVKNFSAEKNYLYNLILDCLDIYHKESDVDRRISKLINIGRILMEKKLDEQGVKILEKARKLSTEHCRHENLLPINQLIIRKSFDKETLTPNDLQDLHKEEQLAIKKLETKLYYRQALDQFSLIRRMIGKTSEKKIFNQLKTSYPYVQEPIITQFDSWDIGVYYLISRLEFCRLTRNREEGRTLALQVFNLMESNRNRITGEYIDRYSYCLYIFIIMHAYNTPDEKETAIHKLRHLDQYIDVKVTTREHARTFEYHYTTLSDIHLKTKEYQKIKETLPEFERAEAIYKEHITPSFNIAMHFNIAALFFGMGEYRQALKWGNKVTTAAIPFRKDIYHYLRTLNLIIHLELNNTETLKSIISSITYYNKKNHIKSLLQNTLIKHCNALFKVHTKQKRIELYKKLKDELIAIKEIPTENSIFEDLDLITWVSKKCESI